MNPHELEDQERFVRRLEAFSDIVFGFALAQSAFSLDVPKALADVPYALTGLFPFALTFIVIGMFWLMHYRVFHYAFAGRSLDITLNFVLLAVVALLPYVLRLFLQFPDSVVGSAAYAAELGVGFTLLTVLERRGLQVRAPSLDPKPLAMMQRAVWRHGASAVVFLVTVPLFVVIGLNARYFWAAIAPAMLVASRLEKSRRRAPGTPAAVAES